MTSRLEGPSLGDVVGAAGLALTLVTAWLYAAGWSYTYYYFAGFQIPLLLTDLPHEHLFVYGGLVLWKNKIASLIGAFVVFGALVLCARYREPLGRFVISSVLVFLVLLAFIVAHVGGMLTGNADYDVQQNADFRAYSRVQLAFEDETLGRTDMLGDIATTNCGRLVLATPERLFLIRPVQNTAELPLAVWIVPTDSVVAVRIEPIASSCP